MKNVYIILFCLLVCSPSQIFSTKAKKKSIKAEKESSETTTDQPAILAIEIVDPNENSTTSKNSKRTIETALGYGYNSYDTSKPRYEVYKYSQHDIPPYKGTQSQLFTGSQNTPIDVQKSVQYTLPTITQHFPNVNNVLSPGTTLYSSLNGRGHVGGLRPSLDQISGLEHNRAPVPVVVLRLHPNQLRDSNIRANLPKSHPYAKSINSINIRSLLGRYIKSQQSPATVNHHQYSAPQNTYSSSQVYSSLPAHVIAPKAQNDHRYQSQAYYKQGVYNRKPNVVAETYQAPSQNYHQQYYQQTPQQNHGYQQQHQYQPQQYSDYSNEAQVQQVPAKYQFRYETSTPQTQYQKQPEQVQQQQYYYVQPDTANRYSTESSRHQYYDNSPTQQVDYNNKEQAVPEAVPPVQQYYEYSRSTPQPDYSKESATPVAVPQVQQYYEYRSTPQPDYSKESASPVAVPQEQQYYTTNDQQYQQEYYQGAEEQQYVPKSEKLLTEENYPSDKHTRVLFRTHSGHVRTSEQEEPSPAKEIKTINIHVPDNIAKVEVQESERPYYSYRQAAYPEEQQQQEAEQPTDQYEHQQEQEQEGYASTTAQKNSYPEQDASSVKEYYNREDSPSDTNYNYQNIDYSQMVKYFARRAAMPSYFYQNPEDGEKEDQKTLSSKEMAAAYEEVAFPSTTKAPEKKKVKGKKRA